MPTVSVNPSKIQTKDLGTTSQELQPTSQHQCHSPNAPGSDPRSAMASYWASIVTAMLLCALTDPVRCPSPTTGVTVNATNVAQNKMNSADRSCIMSEIVTGLPQDNYVLYYGYSISANNLALFNYYGIKVASVGTGVLSGRALVMKGAGRIFAGSETDTPAYIYSVTVSGSTYAITQLYSYSGYQQVSGCGDPDPAVTYAYVTCGGPGNSADYYQKVDLTDNSRVTYNKATDFDYPIANSVYIIAQYGSSIPILTKTNMALVRTVTASFAKSRFLLDCNDDNILFFGDNAAYSLKKLAITSLAGGSLSYSKTYSYSPYGPIDLPLNMGNYQYVVTIPYGQSNPTVLLFDKTGVINNVAYSYTTVSSTYLFYTVAGCVVDKSVASSTTRLWMYAINTGYYLHSFYLTVDRCVNRDGSNVCQECLSGYYRMGTAANNLCNTTAEFLPAWGIVVGTTPALAGPCSDINCAVCLNDTTKCTTCVAGWYLNGFVCQSPTLTPLIPNNFGANTTSQKVVACADVNCRLCKSNYLTCTGCKTGASWYLNGNVCQSPTLTPQIPSQFGANTATGMVVACSDANCLLCKSNYLTCTGCNTASQWYLNGAVCQSPTLTPQIPSQFGANTATGLVVACSDVNCIDCKANYAVCTLCDVANSWYLYTGGCLSPTLTPMIPALYGANTATGLVVNCALANCRLCKPDYNVCTQCNYVTFWYMNVDVCQSPTLTPLIPDGFGADLTTYDVVACADSNCVNCKENHLTCTVCDTANSWYVNAGTCQSPTLSPMIPDFYGANVGTGAVVHCSDLHCLLCKLDYTTCTSCDTANNWYLNGNVCQHPTSSPQIPNFFGADLITGTVAACGVANCKLCKSDLTICTGCDTVSGWYLNGNVCQNAATFPAGYGPNLANGMVEPCVDSACLACSNTIQLCLSCNTTLGFYLNNTSSSCVHTSQMLPGYGPDLLNSNVTACSDNYCTDCHLNYTVCLRCNVTLGYYLFQEACITIPEITAGYGINQATKEVVTCAAGIGCLDCVYNHLYCLACNTTGRYYLNDSLCLKPSQFADGFGVDLQTQTIKPCADANCVKCVDNYQICTECDQANGYIPVNGSCAMPAKLVFQEAYAKIDTVEFAFYLKPNTDGFSQELLLSLETKLPITVNFTDTATNQVEVVSFKSTLKTATGAMTFTIRLLESLKNKDYLVTLSSNASFDLVILGIQWHVTVVGITLKFKNPLTDAEKSIAERQAAMISSLTSVSSGDSATSMTLMGTLMAADPTGTFFRFTKILQIVNKLYFININYGKRLEAFLAKSAPSPSPDPKPNGKPLFVYNVDLSRGKLTFHNVSLDFNYSMTWKPILYSSTWGIRIIKRFLLDNCVMGKVGIYFCHYANKVHLIIFNLVFIDFIWLAPRTLMHSRGLPNSIYFESAIVLFLLAADLCLILAHLLDDQIWRKALEHYTNLRPYLKPGFVPPNEPIKKVGADDKSKKKKVGKKNKNEPQTKQINYQRTYFEIDFNVHLMDLAANRLRISEQSFKTLVGRVMLMNVWLKLPYQQLIVCSCQFSNGLAITCLLCFEIYQVSGSIYAYLKYKYLKNIICLLMEVVSSCGFMIFYLICYLISPKRFDETISDFYQDAGIWIVIASCVAEYLLLLTYIGVAAYDFFKNRKMMKKYNLKAKYSLIHYYTAAELKQFEKKAAKPLIQDLSQDKPLVNIVDESSLKISPKEKEVSYAVLQKELRKENLKRNPRALKLSSRPIARRSPGKKIAGKDDFKERINNIDSLYKPTADARPRQQEVRPNRGLATAAKHGVGIGRGVLIRNTAFRVRL